MSENSSPSDARSAAGRPPLVSAVIVAALAVLTLNVWLAARLVRQQQVNSREHAFWTLCQPGSTPAEREAAFRQLAAAGNREWRSAQLRELNLAGFSLPGVDLQNADFLRTSLAGAKLGRARLCRSAFELADLSGADLSEADMSETWLFQATVKAADFRRAKLRASILKQIRAEDADFVMADLSDAQCMMANFTGASLMGATLSGAKLESAILKGANLSLARLDGADLTDADLTNANWWRARGLTTKQIEQLKQKFSPTDAADAALKNDYARWVGTGAAH